MKQILTLIGFILILVSILSTAIQETQVGVTLRASIVSDKAKFLTAIGSFLLLFGIFGFNWIFIILGTVLILGLLMVVGLI